MSERYNTESRFPTRIDPLIFYQDADLLNIKNVEMHQRLLDEGNYIEAGEYIEHANVDSFCASLFNMIENRTYTLQSFLMDKHTRWYEEHGVETPFWYYNKPEDTDAKPVWTCIWDMSVISNTPLSDGYTLSAIGGFRP